MTNSSIFSESIILQDERVLLRPLELTDLNPLLPFSIKEPELWIYSLLQAGGEENLINYLNGAMYAKQKGTEYPFMVFDKFSNRYAGSTRFYDIQLQQKTLKLGYTWYGKCKLPLFSTCLK